MKSLINTLMIVFLTLGLCAQHEDHGSHGHSKHNDGHHEDGHHSKWHVAVFNGATTNFDHSSTDYTFGIDAEYRFSDLLGAGLGLESIFALHQETVIAVPFFIHPYKGAKIILAPIAVGVSSKWHYGARFGAGYDFHVGKLSVGPTIAFDWTDTKALVYGLSVGMGF